MASECKMKKKINKTKDDKKKHITQILRKGNPKLSKSLIIQLAQNSCKK